MALQREQMSKSQSDFDWEDFDYDIFWCSGSGLGARTQADAIAEALKQEGARGRIRSRILPEAKRKLVGLTALNRYEVHFEPNETEQANAISQLAYQVTSQKFETKPNTSKTKTAWYLSVFVCPSSTLHLR